MTNPESKAAARHSKPARECQFCGQLTTNWFTACCDKPSCREKLETSAAKLLGRKGGLSRSEAKVRAAKENGKKGGKPKLNISPDMERRGYTGEPINKSSGHLSQGRT